jgi:hypothetical protein
MTARNAGPYRPRRLHVRQPRSHEHHKPSETGAAGHVKTLRRGLAPVIEICVQGGPPCANTALFCDPGLGSATAGLLPDPLAALSATRFAARVSVPVNADVARPPQPLPGWSSPSDWRFGCGLARRHDPGQKAFSAQGAWAGPAQRRPSTCRLIRLLSQDSPNA